MGLTQELSDAIDKVRYRQIFSDQIGDWYIHTPGIKIFNVVYKEIAHYCFSVDENDSHVLFLNLHREAHTGTGTATLQSLERAMLGISTHKDILIDFLSGGQHDTFRWLKKNGYTGLFQDGTEYYRKVLERLNQQQPF